METFQVIGSKVLENHFWTFSKFEGDGFQIALLPPDHCDYEDICFEYCNGVHHSRIPEKTDGVKALIAEGLMVMLDFKDKLYVK